MCGWCLWGSGKGKGIIFRVIFFVAFSRVACAVSHPHRYHIVVYDTMYYRMSASEAFSFRRNAYSGVSYCTDTVAYTVKNHHSLTISDKITLHQHKYTCGTMHRYIKTVASAAKGCVTDE